MSPNTPGAGAAPQVLPAVLERANKAIKAIAEAEKFDVILQEAAYVAPRVDITDKVIKAMADGK